MKKVLVILVALAVSTVSTFAVNPEKSEVFYKLNNEKVFNGLNKYLGTSGEQAENLKFIFETTETKMKKAEKRNDDNAFDKAVVFNLANAKYLLSQAQYRKYLMLLNLTLANKDLDVYAELK